MSEVIPKGWIVRFDGDYKLLSKVYYNPETQQIFRKKEDFYRYINYFTTKAKHLHGTKPLWKDTMTEEKDPKGKGVLPNYMLEEDEEEENLGSIYVPKDTTMKFQSSTSKETLSKTYEVGKDSSNDDDDEDDDDIDDDEYKPRKTYKRPRKQNGKETESAEKGTDDHRLPTTTPRRRRSNNWQSRNRNVCGNSSGKAH